MSNSTAQDSARIIQAAWRSYSSRKKLDTSKNDEKLFRDKNDAIFHVKLRNFQRQRLLRQQRLHLISQLPANQVPEFVQNEENDAIIKIQANWRGISERKNFNQEKVFLLKNKCATKIQRWFRKQMKLKWEEMLRRNYMEKSQLSKDRVSFLQTKIDEYQSTCKVRLNTEEQRRLHANAQEKYLAFYSTEQRRKEDKIRRKILLDQLNNDIEILSNPIRLQDLSLTSHRSSSKLVQTKSKQLHELTVKNFNRPWRKRLNNYGSIFSE